METIWRAEGMSASKGSLGSVDSLRGSDEGSVVASGDFTGSAVGSGSITSLASTAAVGSSVCSAAAAGDSGASEGTGDIDGEIASL